MYAVNVRDHLMIAHSFKGATFGSAQRLHGATYVIDVEFQAPALDADGLVVDIGRASELLHNVLAAFNYRNLDEVTELAGRNTTTEFMARVIFERVKAAILAGELGGSGQGVTRLRVKLHESHIAWAAYEEALAASG